jgi:hypothetical protein
MFVDRLNANDNVASVDAASAVGGARLAAPRRLLRLLTRRLPALWCGLLALALVAASVATGDVGASAFSAGGGTAMLAYAQSGRVWWISTDGRPRALPVRGYATEAALAPDGRWLAYLLIPDSALGQAPLPAQLWLADLTTGAAQPLAADLSLRGQLAWSPDGARLALIERGQLASYDPASGAREVVAQQLAPNGPAFAGYAWLPDGSGLICLTQDDTGRQWVELISAGSDAPHRTPVPGSEQATAVALSPGGQMATLLLARGALVELRLDGGSLASLTSTGGPVAAFAWSSVGARLAFASPEGRLWLAVRGASGIEAIEPLAALSAPVTRLSWNAAGQIEATLATRGGQAVALVTPGDGSLRTAGLSPLAAAQAAPLEPPTLADVGAPFAWYRAQGDSDSGICASTNCGPTTVAMAIQFTHNGLNVPISQIRTYMTGSEPCGYGTTGDQLRAALTHWSVPFTRITGLTAVRDAINVRGHIVIVPVIMADIAPGVDYNTAYTSPANVYGRYYTFTGGHWVVVRGISADGQWVKVYDPNVWADGRYYYSDYAPKGRDRLYRYSEFATAFANNGNWAIEIMAVPTATPTPTVTPSPTTTPTPTATPPPSSGAPQPPTNVQASGVYADRVAVTWTPPTGAMFYSVHRSDTAAGAKQLLGLPAQASWDDASIAPGVTGYYWVTACNTDGCSDHAGPAAGLRSIPSLADLPSRAWMPIAGYAR